MREQLRSLRRIMAKLCLCGCLSTTESSSSPGHAGLVTLMAVKAFGADAVAIADIKRDNLDLAMKLGADVALNPDRDAAPQEVATWMRAALPPHGPDMVIDCAGFEPTLQVYSALLATLLPLLVLQDVCGRAQPDLGRSDSQACTHTGVNSQHRATYAVSVPATAGAKHLKHPELWHVD